MTDSKHHLLAFDSSKSTVAQKNRWNRYCIGFIVGFILSTILAVIAVALTFGVFSFVDPIGNEMQQKTVEDTCERRIVGYHHLAYPYEMTVKKLSLLTHIVFYPFDIQDNGTIPIGSSTKKEKLMKLVKTASLTNVKTMISLGDGKVSSSNFFLVVADPIKREVLIKEISEIITEFNLDGIDIQWRWPENANSRAHLVQLCKELRLKLTSLKETTNRNESLIISAFSGLDKDEKNHKDILKYVDFLNLETDNYYGDWHRKIDTLVGPPSPLYGGHNNFSNHNVDSTVKYYSCATRQPNKLNIVVPFNGRFWLNVKNSSDTLWMTTDPKTDSKQNWFEWRWMKPNGWDTSKYSWNHESRTPYIWKPENKSYLAFENEKSLQEKVDYAVEKNIGGMTMWTLDYDDIDDTLEKVVAAAELCSGKNNTNVKFDCY